MPTFSPLPDDYAERVYAGLRGKLVGVYLGRPFEGWLHHEIMERLGPITGYVHERLGLPLIVTDDDITGTLTFLRALADHEYSYGLSSAQIGETWLNYIIEGKTILWWGGLGVSTEHTAFTRLKQGIPAPQSGSIALNGRTVAEQIGAQIFIDGWGLIHPGDPARAADMAARAARVSHDGIAVHGAQVVAAMVAAAFVEHDINAIIDAGLAQIPPDSLLHALAADIRAWHAQHPDWESARDEIARKYGYDSYGGGCHIVPNHALILLALLYSTNSTGADGVPSFDQAMMIVNTAGWDTDCNAGNVGCILGVRGGLSAIDDRWTAPIADRLYLPTADGGRAITDATNETLHIVNTARRLRGMDEYAPKDGARYHFSLPGSVQGFMPCGNPSARLDNTNGRLALTAALSAGEPVRVATATFIPPEALDMPNYGLLAAPTLYPGQTVTATLQSFAVPQGATMTLSLFIRVYDTDDTLSTIDGPSVEITQGGGYDLSWRVPDTDARPIAEIGFAVMCSQAAPGALVYLDRLTWSGTPDFTIRRPQGANARTGTAWQRQWVDAVDHVYDWEHAFQIAHDSGRGHFITGTRDWHDYTVETTLTPTMADAFGLAARFQGLRRYVALLLDRDESGAGRARLIWVHDGVEDVMAAAAYDWALGVPVNIQLSVGGRKIRALVDGEVALSARSETPRDGGIALLVTNGRIGTDAVTIRPVART